MHKPIRPFSTHAENTSFTCGSLAPQQTEFMAFKCHFEKPNTYNNVNCYGSGIQI